VAAADLVRMADQIAANLAYLGPDAAAEATADHIERFWSRSMRSELRNAVAPGELSEIARCAAELLRKRAPAA
jgi:hypothetical protein